jgi:cytochrome P450
MGTTYYKAPYYYKSLFNESIVGILNPERHHTRRRTVQSMFSVKAIDSMAPYIIRRARKAAESVANRAQQGLPINLNRLYRSISVSHCISKTIEHSPQLKVKLAPVLICTT